MRRLLILLLPLASLCACREKARTGQNAAVPEEHATTPEDPGTREQITRERRSPDRPERSPDAGLKSGPLEDASTPDLPIPAAEAILVKPAVIPQGIVLPEEQEQAVNSSLPGPERARAAAARVRPELEQSLAAKGLHFGDPVFLRAFKEEGQVELWVRNRSTGKYDLFRTWDVAEQSGKPGPKLAEGDGQVPEGFYHVGPAAMKPDSTFHLAFNIGYPNAYDQHHGRTGSFIMIHGNCVSIGCLAMTDPKIEEIYTLCDAALKKGQPYFRVNLFPFRMTPERLSREKDSEWHDFWMNLKEGYDHFESSHVPPEVEVVGSRYVFK